MNQKADPQKFHTYQYLDFGLPGLQTGEKYLSPVYMLYIVYGILLQQHIWIKIKYQSEYFVLFLIMLIGNIPHWYEL